ncbi:MAG: chemotaxis protein CheB [Bacteroidales bacterium]
MKEKRAYQVVVIGGSAGSFPVVRKILSTLPAGYPLPVVFCLHRLKEVRHGLLESLAYVSNLPVEEPGDKQRVEPGRVYLAPANYHLLVEEEHTFALSIDREINFSRPSIDLTFASFGHVYGGRMLGIILSGANVDGASGMLQAHRRGALAVIQDPEEALVGTMPRKVLGLFQPDHILTSDGIVRHLLEAV